MTTGVCARIGPCPSSCGSTAWSPGAQMVCDGRQPSARIRVFTAARRSSAVNRRPSRRSHPSRPMRQRLQGGDPGREARLRRPQRGADRAHLGRGLDLALGPEGIGLDLEAHAELVQLHREAERESCAAPTTVRTFRCRSAAAMTAAAPPRPPRASTFRAKAVHDSTSSTVACRRARSISRSLMTSTRFPPRLHEEERVRARRSPSGRGCRDRSRTRRRAGAPRVAPPSGARRARRAASSSMESMASRARPEASGRDLEPPPPGLPRLARFRPGQEGEQEGQRHQPPVAQAPELDDGDHGAGDEQAFH